MGIAARPGQLPPPVLQSPRLHTGSTRGSRRNWDAGRGPKQPHGAAEGWGSGVTMLRSVIFRDNPPGLHYALGPQSIMPMPDSCPERYINIPMQHVSTPHIHNNAFFLHNCNNKLSPFMPGFLPILLLESPKDAKKTQRRTLRVTQAFTQPF